MGDAKTLGTIELKFKPKFILNMDYRDASPSKNALTLDRVSEKALKGRPLDATVKFVSVALILSKDLTMIPDMLDTELYPPQGFLRDIWFLIEKVLRLSSAI
jgi:hypothetical protein